MFGKGVSKYWGTPGFTDDDSSRTSGATDHGVGSTEVGPPHGTPDDDLCELWEDLVFTYASRDSGRAAPAMQRRRRRDPDKDKCETSC